MHVAGVEADAAHLRAHRPGARSATSATSCPRSSRGKATIRSQAEQAGLELDDGGDRARGRAAEGARAPRLPLRGGAGLLRAAAAARGRRYEPLFELESFRVITEKRADGGSRPRRRSRSRSTASATCAPREGNGPVNALDRALRGAITERHPHLADIELTNYKVRILDETHGTDAVTRVLLDSSDGEREWGTIGVSENIIEASWEALVDSLEYAFQPRAEASAE